MAVRALVLENGVELPQFVKVRTFHCRVIHIYTMLSFPTIIAVVCSDIPAPDNGRITYSTDTTSPYDFGTVATYVCNTRFGLVGVGSRSCVGDDTSLVGSWSETGSTCEG